MRWCTAELRQAPQASSSVTVCRRPAQVLGQLMTRALAVQYRAGLKAYQRALASGSEVQTLPLVAWSSGREGIDKEVVRAAEENVLDTIIRCLPVPVPDCWQVQQRVPAISVSHHMRATDSDSAQVRVAA